MQITCKFTTHFWTFMLMHMFEMQMQHMLYVTNAFPLVSCFFLVQVSAPLRLIFDCRSPLLHAEHFKPFYIPGLRLWWCIFVFALCLGFFHRTFWWCLWKKCLIWTPHTNPNPFIAPVRLCELQFIGFLQEQLVQFVIDVVSNYKLDNLSNQRNNTIQKFIAGGYSQRLCLSQNK